MTRNIDAEVLAVIPFMASNDISIRPAKREITADDKTYYYGESVSNKQSHSIRRTQTIPLRSPPATTTIWPGDFVEISTENEKLPDPCIAIEPRIDTI